MIAARWLGLPSSAGRCFFCRPASVGELGFEHGRRDQPVIYVWNYTPQNREQGPMQPRMPVWWMFHSIRQKNFHSDECFVRMAPEFKAKFVVTLAATRSELWHNDC
jgi:hypothetical protein